MNNNFGKLNTNTIENEINLRSIKNYFQITS